MAVAVGIGERPVAEMRRQQSESSRQRSGVDQAERFALAAESDRSRRARRMEVVGAIASQAE